MARCKSCKAEILWAESSLTGRPMPLDPKPVDPGEKVIGFAVVDGKAHRYTHVDKAAARLCYVSHFSTCPQAGYHRKPRATETIPPGARRKTAAPIVMDGRVVGIACGIRGEPCAEPNCGAPHEFLCDFPLAGKKAGKTCSRKLCKGCAKVQAEKATDGTDRHYCPAHDRIAHAQPKLI